MVEVIDGFMDAATCEALVELARPRLAKSKVWDIATGSEKEDDYRVSEQMFFGRSDHLTSALIALEMSVREAPPGASPEVKAYDSPPGVKAEVERFRRERDLIRSIEEAIESTTGIRLNHGEGIQVLHYNPGGYYKPHYDYFDPQFDGNKAVLGRGGQRKATFMVYLNDVEEGGGTSFPQQNFLAVPKTGRALFWKNVKEDGSLDPDTLHAAEPVIKGEKWIFTKWLREKEFV